MFKSLEINGFRCFRELRVGPLTRVNLFVGQNNAGKTSLLEAVELVAKLKGHVVDPSHLFFGHDLQAEKFFKIKADGDPEGWIQCSVENASAQESVIRTFPTPG